MHTIAFRFHTLPNLSTKKAALLQTNCSDATVNFDRYGVCRWYVRCFSRILLEAVDMATLTCWSEYGSLLEPAHTLTDGIESSTSDAGDIRGTTWQLYCRDVLSDP